jgi:hypothetical protein
MSEPTKEERVAREIVGKLAGHDEDNCGLSGWDPSSVCTCPPDESYHLALAILTRFRREAKVEAHLEDARAGCRYCRNRTDLVVSDTPVHDGEQWVHLRRADLQPWESCERPEVWDVLSALRGETR